MRWIFRIALVAFAASALAVGSWPLAEESRASALSSPVNRQPSTVNSQVTIPVLGVQSWALNPTFDQARAGHIHHALDILAPRGTPVIAAVDGTIRKLDTGGAGGITIYQFDGDESFVYYYAHLDRYARGIREGLSVKRGEVIGYVGTTGNAPERTPHLHFAIGRLPAGKEWWKGEPIDPYPILTRPASTPQTLASGTD
jgi:murein DD-endopeptidase MepM/ murein hydrolase activator NlpD